MSLGMPSTKDGIPKKVKPMEGQMIRVMIVDDHAMVRAGMKILLEESEDIAVIGEANNGQQAIELVEKLDPDVILMDLHMPVMDGIEATRRIMANRPNQHILVLTGLLDDERLFQSIQAGAQGCVDKTIQPEELVQTIRSVSSGNPFLSPSVAWRILRGLAGSEKPAQPKDRLSNREIQILRLMTQGKLDAEIAHELVLTEVTIRTHISRILSKLGLENRVQAALYSLRSGLVSVSETYDALEGTWK
jgi:DNA-binding NarL/FixJ family response regulator